MNIVLPKLNKQIVLSYIVSLTCLIIFLFFTKIKFAELLILDFNRFWYIPLLFLSVLISYLNISSLSEYHKKTFVNFNIITFLVVAVVSINGTFFKNSFDPISKLVVPLVISVYLVAGIIYYLATFGKYILNDLSFKADKLELKTLTPEDNQIIVKLSLIYTLYTLVIPVTYNLIGIFGLFLLGIFTFFKSILYFNLRIKMNFSVYYVFLLELLFTLVLSLVAFLAR